MKLFAILFFIFTIDAFALNTVDTGYDIAAGANKTINVHGVCRKVSNLATLRVFVPTKTSPEWLNFISNPPSGVVASQCCSGHLYNGFCYYLSNLEEACTTTCALRGGCNPTGISHAIVSTATICQTLVTATSGYSAFTATATDQDYTGQAPGDTLGCVFFDGRVKDIVYTQAIRMTSGLAPRCDTAPTWYGRRVCACNL